MNLRLLAAILLAANLMYLGWAVALRPEPTQPATGRAAPVPPDSPRLALVTELPADQRQALERPRDPPSDPAAPVEAPAAGAGLLCVAVGPFDDPTLAAQVADRLRQSGGMTVDVREESGQLRTGYWVHLPPFPSQEDAEKVAQDLRQKGAGELFIVTTAEQRHAISLGLFSTQERADQRAAEVAKLGFRPRIAERFREGPVQWLEYRELAEQAVDLAPMLAGLDPAIQRSARACPPTP